MKQAGAGFSVAADIFFCGKKTVCAKMFSFMIKLFLSAKIETYLPTKKRTYHFHHFLGYTIKDICPQICCFFIIMFLQPTKKISSPVLVKYSHAERGRVTQGNSIGLQRNAPLVHLLFVRYLFFKYFHSRATF